MSTVKKFEKQPVIPDPPNTRTDTKAAFLQKADAFNPGLKAWADSFNASTVDNLNALVDVLNQQLPYINTVSDADAAIRAVYTALAQVNTVSAGMDSVNACATWMDKIKLVAENKSFQRRATRKRRKNGRSWLRRWSTCVRRPRTLWASLCRETGFPSTGAVS